MSKEAKIFVGAVVATGLVWAITRKKGVTPPPPPPPGKATLYGQVNSAGKPIADALITVRGITRSVSDANGNYTVDMLDPGPAPVFCSKPGYITTVPITLNLVEGENNRYDFVLTSELQPELYLSNLQINQRSPYPGHYVVITALATTNVSSTYSVSLKINGVVVQTKNVSVGEEKVVDFQYTPTLPGIYQVEMDGLSGEFEVQSLPVLMYLENLQISPSYPLVGSQVQITAIATTDVSGTYPASLTINGALVQTKNVSITAGEAKVVSFTYTPAIAGIYQVELDPPYVDGHRLTGQFEAVSGLMCYNDGLLFATQAELDAHIQASHPSWPAGAAPCLINKISWGSNSLTRPSWGQRLVAGGMYLLDKKQTPQPYGPLSVTFETFNLWLLYGPNDEPNVQVAPNIFIGKFGDIGPSPFRTTAGSAGVPWLLLTSGGTIFTPTGDSGKTFTMTIPPYADLAANMPPGLYDVMVFVRMPGASLPGWPVPVELQTYFYVILDAWRVP